MRCFLIIFTFLSLAISANAQCILQIKGQVKDADTRLVLEKASVSLVGTKTVVITDAQGNFQLAGLCPGDYTLRISHAGCQTIDFHVHLKEDLFKTIELPHAENVLKEVVVVGSASVQTEGMSGELRGRELAQTRGLTLGESLQKINGVSVLQTGNNIYKPVIQGLHSSRVLILNNGIRQEGQQWGSEHAPEIDPYVANRLTVIKGASAVKYGGDAIGGVVLVEPRLLRYKKELSGEVNLAAFSNNRQGVASAMMEGSFSEKENSAWRLQATYKRGGNARTPDYWLKNSGVEEINMSATAGWRSGSKGVELFYSLFNTKLGIFTGAHIGNLTDLENIIRDKQPPVYIRDADFSYAIDRPYQGVQHHLVKVKAYQEINSTQRLNFTYSTQYNVRREYDITRSETSIPQLELNLMTHMADLVWEHYGNKPLKGSVGVNAMYQDNYINYRYFIPNFQALDLGIWAAEKYQFKSWQFELGMRFDNRNRFNISDNDKAPFDMLMGNALQPGDPYGRKNFSGLSGTGVMAYQFNERLRTAITFSSAWRAPQMNELFSNGLHHGAARIEKGVSTLQTERAWNTMAAVVYNDDRWEAEIGLYHKTIKDFIYLKPTYPPLLTIRGAFPSFEFAQTDASLTGADLSLSYRFNNHLKSAFKSSLLRAYDVLQKTWLIQMPADRYQGELSYSFIDGKKMKSPYLNLAVQHVTEQKRVPPSGNIKITDANGIITMASDYIPPPSAYTLVNIDAGTGIEWGKRRLDWTLSIQNLFNTAYRDYMNAFRYFSLDRGRNISLKLKITI
jgi:iron complex outermembrane receptor protein